jgi:hypothetical protein
MPGQLTIIIGLLALAGGVMWWVADSRAETRDLAARQEELRTYTGVVGDLVASLQPTVPEMLGAPFNTANKELIAELKESVPKWSEDIELAAAKTQTLAPPENLQRSSVVIQQAFMLYRSAVLTYKLVPAEDDEGRQQKLIERANDQRDLAGQSLTAALGMIDDERAAAEMGPSAIQPPSTMTPILPTASPPPEDGKDAGNGGGKDGGRADRSDDGGQKDGGGRKKRDG